jgi:hypothetical protein
MSTSRVLLVLCIRGLGLQVIYFCLSNSRLLFLHITPIPSFLIFLFPAMAWFGFGVSFFIIAMPMVLFLGLSRNSIVQMIVANSLFVSR